MDLVPFKIYTDECLFCQSGKATLMSAEPKAFAAADSRALSLDRKRFEEIKVFFGCRAEIMAGLPPPRKAREEGALLETITGMAKRRPIRAKDVANSVNRPLSGG